MKLTHIVKDQMQKYHVQPHKYNNNLMRRLRRKRYFDLTANYAQEMMTFECQDISMDAIGYQADIICHKTAITTFNCKQIALCEK